MDVRLRSYPTAHSDPGRVATNRDIWTRLAAIVVAACVLIGSAGVPVANAQVSALALQKQTVAAFDRSLEQYRRDGNIPAHTERLHALGPDFARSAEALAKNDPGAAATSLAYLGTVQRVSLDWKRADATYRMAVELAERGKAPRAAARAWRGRSFIAGRINGDYAAAVDFAEKAVALALDVDPRIELDAWLDITHAQRFRNDPAAANAALERVKVLAEESGRPQDLASVWTERGELQMWWVNRCVNEGSGPTDPCVEALAAAERNFQSALTIARESGYRGILTEVNIELQYAASQRAVLNGHDASMKALAKEYGPQKESVARKAGDVASFDFGYATMAPAVNLSDKGKQLVAAELADLRRSREALGLAPTAQWRYDEAVMLASLGNKDEALRGHLEAVALLEAEREKYADDRSRSSFMEDKVKFYYAPFSIFLSDGRYAEAFDLLERSRARGTTELIAARSPDLATAADRADYAEVQRLEAMVAERRKQALDQRIQGKAPTPQALQVLLEQERALATLKQGLQARGSKIGQLASAHVATLDEARQLSRAGRYDILYYFLTGRGLVIWHIGPTAMQLRFVPLASAGKMQVKIERLRKNTINPTTRYDTDTARDLFLNLVEPVQKFLETDHLVIVPDSHLVGLSFQSLQDTAGGFLGERYKVSYAPSVSLLMSVKPPRKLAGARVLAVADPGLEFAADEVKAIGDLFAPNATIVTDRLIPKSEAKTVVRGYDVVHFAVHGVFRGNQPMLSSLALGPKGREGELTAAEMFGLPLGSAQLVVLSACESGRSEVTSSNEMLGFQRALLFAGAQSLVVSSWRIDTVATASWMKTFYRVAQMNPPAEASRAAIRALRAQRSFAHPFYWASFNLIGS